MLRAFTDNRHLLRELVFRDIRSRYVGSIMGLFWSVLNPLLLLLLYTFVVAGIFRERLAAGDSTSLLAASIFCGLLPWLAVQESIIRSATCYLEEQNLIKKLRFPLEVLPLKITVSAIAHQLVGSAVFVIVLAIAGLGVSWRLVFIPAIVITQILLTYGAGLIVASLNVYFRDIAHILGPLFLGVFWITPIVYQRGMTGTGISTILGFNPLTHLIEAYRWTFLATARPSWEGLAYVALFSIAVFGLGRVVLGRTRTDVVDFI